MSSLHISQNVKLGQTVSQKMIQSVKILQMNAQELSDFISELSLENPMVELSPESFRDEDEMRLRKLEWLSNLDEQNRAFYKYDREDAEDTRFMNNVSGRRTETLEEVLRLQLLSGHYSPREMEVFDYIIGSLDDRGFFVLPASHLMDVFGMSAEDAESYLKIMRDLDPAGICAAGPRECLLKQIDRKNDPDWDIERRITENFLQQLGKNKLPEIAEKLGQPLNRIITALERIRELNPYPAQGFDTGEALHYITPDITIVKFPDRFEILLNQFSYPEIRINKYYLKLLRSDCDQETKTYLTAKLKQIEETREHIAHRGRTLMALAEFLLSRQQDFFMHGESSLSPLKMKEAAASIGVHESTISRAVRDKYLQCPWGLFPLSYFFSAGLGSEDSEQISSRRIKAEIRALIDQENSAKPLSDQKICDLLQEKGVAVSRRTVAKYREEMGIGSTRERKSWK
ncbi:MAG: RNA polymerase factor sigma-54 [Lachnospiraceae bacterium]|nr:RNA polymerase factor sigma-54 [Lachnospiraceae bacterium]